MLKTTSSIQRADFGSVIPALAGGLKHPDEIVVSHEERGGRTFLL
jgi:hypothetical protein